MTRLQKWLTASFVAAALLIPALAAAQQGSFRSDYLRNSPAFKKAFRPIVAAARKATVEVYDGNNVVALGTVVSPDGLILTKASEIGEKPIVRLYDGRKLDAKLLARHTAHDLALLQVEASDLPTVQFRPSKEVGVGHWAVSVGTGEDPIALGVVSVPLRNVPLPKGPLPPLQGGYLGIMLAPEGGPRVGQVMPNTGAAKAGMKAEDLIINIAGQTIKEAGDVRKALAKFKAGETVVVKVLRDDEEITLKVKLSERPPTRGEIQNKMGSELSKRIDGFPVILTHDSVIPPKFCGGPLVDLEGKVIGINISRAGRTETYAIPTEAVLPLLAEMRAGKHRVTNNQTNETGGE